MAPENTIKLRAKLTLCFLLYISDIFSVIFSKYCFIFKCKYLLKLCMSFPCYFWMCVIRYLLFLYQLTVIIWNILFATTLSKVTPPQKCEILLLVYDSCHFFTSHVQATNCKASDSRLTETDTKIHDKQSLCPLDLSTKRSDLFSWDETSPLYDSVSNDSILKHIINRPIVH